jgi:cyclase
MTRLHHIPTREIAERPDGYAGPNLSPSGLKLMPRRVADGVYALMANIPPKDNNGVIVGTRAMLVVDAGITPNISLQIQALAAELSDRPLRYLVNTTYHGDHTFGNSAFPANVIVVSSRLNKQNMSDLEYEKATRSGNMYGDEAFLEAVTDWRTPDVVFDSFAEVDLGGRAVQLWHFGAGNGPGDIIVYAADVRTAWTGNYLVHAGIAPMLLQGGPDPYLSSLRRMRETLPELQTIVPGHGPMGDAHAAIEWLIAYLERLRDEVRRSFESGRTADEAIARSTDPWAHGLDSALADAIEEYTPNTPGAADAMLALVRNLHRLNILATYRLLEASVPKD